MEQDSFLQRGQRIDVLDVRRSARHVLQNQINLALSERHQWQELRRNHLSPGVDTVRRHHHFGPACLLRLPDCLCQTGQRRLREQGANVGVQSLPAHALH